MVDLNWPNVLEVDEILSAATKQPLFAASSDRATWEQVRLALPADEVSRCISSAESCLASPMPPLPASLYLQYDRDGSREGYQEPMHARRRRLATLPMAECLEGSGRFLDALLDTIWAICEESSWANPAHQHRLADLDHPIIDLAAATTALALAEAHQLVGGSLDPLVAKRIRDETDRRIITPYLTSHHGWMHKHGGQPASNWAAVCTAGVLGTAIHLEPDISREAEIIARGIRTIADYLDGFGADGGSSEGPGYWSYGFGSYTILADLLSRRTNGAIDLLGGDKIRRIAEFPWRTQLSPGHMLPFSDCPLNATLNPTHLVHLADTLGLDSLRWLAAQHAGGSRDTELPWALRGLLWRSDMPAAPHPLPTWDWFPDLSWMISRISADPAGLVVAAKGGHNAELHNQNDVGSFVVHVNGESLVAELGAGRYTKDYFGPRRYEQFVNSSLGHSVPVADGCPQKEGQTHAGAVLDARHGAERDVLVLDLTAAYPERAHLQSLIRSIVVDRHESGAVELTDSYEFREADGTLASVLITLGVVLLADRAVTIQGDRAAVRIRYNPAEVEVTVDTRPQVDLHNGPQTVHRIVFATLGPARNGTINLRITPADNHEAVEQETLKP